MKDKIKQKKEEIRSQQSIQFKKLKPMSSPIQPKKLLQPLKIKKANLPKSPIRKQKPSKKPFDIFSTFQFYSNPTQIKEVTIRAKW
jgi:hypothetical protein